MNRPMDPRIADGWEPVYAPLIIEDALSASACDRAIATAEKLGFHNSPVYDNQGLGSVDDPSYRRSRSVWLQPEHDRELYGTIQSLFARVNAERFRFSIYGMAPIQILKYSPGDFFSEHFDIGLGDAAKRKISLLIQLSGPADYEGGAVALGDRLTLPKTRGIGCAFPSWFPHRVDKLESGTRYSLAAWAKGNYFS